MKFLGAVLIGIAVGFFFGWTSSPGPFQHFYKTTRSIEILGDGGRAAGWLPAGMILISDEKLERAPDLGWWAYVPVRFDTMWDALDLGVEPQQKVDPISRITLHANSDRLSPGG